MLLITVNLDRTAIKPAAVGVILRSFLMFNQPTKLNPEKKLHKIVEAPPLLVLEQSSVCVISQSAVFEN